MNSPRNYLIVLLAATTLGGAFLAWRQYGELVELRAAAMNRDERADLQKRVWDLEKLNRQLQEQAGPRGPGSMEGGPGDEDRARGRGERGGSGGRGDVMQRQVVAIQELMSRPEVQAMLNLQARSGIEARYATLFKNLNLTPDQAGKLTALLAERGTTMQDVMTVAREQGVNPRENPEAFRKLVADTQNEINQSIKAVIGDQGFAQLTSYEQTLPQRNVVNELQQRLSYTSTPLTATQAEQLVQILATNAPPRVAGVPGSGPPSGPPPPPDGGARMGPVIFNAGPGGPPGRGPDLGGLVAGIMGPGGGQLVGAIEAGRGAGGAPVTAAAVTQAQTILAPPQVAALQQIQQQQQAQQQLRQMVNDTLSSTQPSRPDGTKGPPPSGRKGGG